GASRFTDFQSQLGAPPSTVAARLSVFTGEGILGSTGNRYRLTDKGRAFFPVLVTALQWAQRWYPDPEGPAVVLTHAVCGGRFAPVLVCDRCGEPLRGGQVLPAR
ncbi:MAG: transcriptional regulator, partial [Mycobacterium sp.]